MAVILAGVVIGLATVSIFAIRTVRRLAPLRFVAPEMMIFAAAEVISFSLLSSHAESSFMLLFFQVLLSFILCIPPLISKHTQFVPLCASTALLFAYAITFWQPIGEYAAESELRSELRSEFPLVSVSNRLKYETSRSAPVAERTSSSTLSEKVDRALIDYELAAAAKPSSDGVTLDITRRLILKLMHTRTLSDFVTALEFGNDRMPSVTSWRKYVVLPEPPSIRLECEPQQAHSESLENESDKPDANGVQAEGPIARTELRALHLTGFRDFTNLDRMGYVRDRDHVAGFRAHRFTKYPQTFERWRIVRLELISLLKHPEPVAYVSDNLPNMDELKDAQTRSLSSFEHQAVERLRWSEDLVIDEAPERISMVGSIRAAQDCRKCHLVDRGTLLGGFTYELRSSRPNEPL